MQVCRSQSLGAGDELKGPRLGPVPATAGSRMMIQQQQQNKMPLSAAAEIQRLAVQASWLAGGSGCRMPDAGCEMGDTRWEMQTAGCAVDGLMARLGAE